jgi:SAM-dependent methyltransferase
MPPAFEPAWLAARRPFDEAALDERAIRTIRRWADGRRDADPLRVVDLGSGVGAALQRALPWLGDGPCLAFAVDTDQSLLATAPTTWRERGWAVHPLGESMDAGRSPYEVVRDGQCATVIPLITDALAPLDMAGGPADGSIDLVLAHAFADLVPLDRLAARVHALLRPGGLAHLALTYDGETVFEPTDDAPLEARIIAAYHRHMDASQAESESYGGSTAGRRVAPAFEAAGLRMLRAAPSIWQVRSDPGEGVAARAVLSCLIRFVVDSQSHPGEARSDEITHWERSKCAALAAGELSVRVRHVDVLATKP